jgi:hypothetical protein
MPPQHAAAQVFDAQSTPRPPGPAPGPAAGIWVRGAISDLRPLESIMRRIVIEDLNLNPAVKKAIKLLLYRTHIKVLADALAC